MSKMYNRDLSITICILWLINATTSNRNGSQPPSWICAWPTSLPWPRRYCWGTRPAGKVTAWIQRRPQKTGCVAEAGEPRALDTPTHPSSASPRESKPGRRPWKWPVLRVLGFVLGTTCTRWTAPGWWKPLCWCAGRGWASWKSRAKILSECHEKTMGEIKTFQTNFLILSPNILWRTHLSSFVVASYLNKLITLKVKPEPQNEIIGS